MKGKSFLIMMTAMLFLLACGLTTPSVPEGFDGTAEAIQQTVEAGAIAAGEAAATSAAELQEADLQATAQAVGNQVEGIATTMAIEGSDAVTALEEAGFDVSYLEEKFAGAVANENGEITITVQEEEVNAVLLLREQAALTAGNLPTLRNVRVDFQAGGTLLLLADIQEPFVAQLIVSFRPVITDGTVSFEIESAEVGRADVPDFVISAMEGSVNTTLAEAIARVPANVVVNSVTIDDTTMVVTGTTGQ